MSGPRVLLHAGAPEAIRAIVAGAHPDARIATCADQTRLAEAARDHRAEVIYSVRSGGMPFPGGAILGLPDLRWLAVGGSGTDHLSRWDPARLTVTNASGVAAGMMAEYVLGTLLSVTLGLRARAADQAARRWDASATVAPLAGRTALVLGLGGTGRAVARLLSVAGLRVIGVRARPEDTPGCDDVHAPAALPALWGRADVVVLCVPLVEATRGIVDGAAFEAMVRRPILVDVSRGGVIDPAALEAALAAGRLRAAILDVFETEPLPLGSPLWDHPDVIVTPHCSAVHDGWERASAELFARNLARWRAGEALENEVDPARGY